MNTSKDLGGTVIQLLTKEVGEVIQDLKHWCKKSGLSFVDIR